MTEDHDSTGVESRELAKLVAALSGVADVEIDLREDGAPRLRVKLDGSRSESEVEIAIREAVAASGSPSVGVRRTGLGRDLGEILEKAKAAVPSFLETGVTESTVQTALALVAVEESAGGVSVRVADSAGGLSFSPVADPRSLNQAIVSAVARLRRVRPVPRLAGVEIRDVEGSTVLNVVLELADGRRTVGAALVEGGMPFTLGRAVWEALS
jgi:hypothetical protein